MTLKAQRSSAQSFACSRWLAKIDALRSSTALVPVITALAGGVLLLAPTTAFAQSGGLGVGGTGAGTTDDFGNGTPGSVGRDTAPSNRDPGAGGGGGGPAAAGGAGAPGGAAGGAAGQNGGFFPIPTGGGDGGPGGGTANGGGGGGGGNYVIHVVSGVPFATGGPIYGYGGGNGGFRGGGGGAGGNNLVIPIGSPVRVIVSGGDVRGGPGGNGGSGGPPQARGAPGTSGGEGGDGGNGFLLAPPSGAPGSVIELNATTIVTGGTGGSGGAVTFRGGRQGAGGDAGAAIRAIGWRIQNAGTLLGGNGGDGGGNAAGGAGIRGSNLTIINSGTISGGLFGDRQTRASAIFLTGGTNSLTLNGGQIIGNIVINGNGSLDLISSTDRTLTNAISGNGSVTLSGSGKITLGGVNTFTGPLTVSNTTVTLNTPVAGDVTVAQGGTLVLGVNNAVGGRIITTGSVLSYLDGVTNNRPLTIGSDTTQLEVISGTGTQSGVIEEEGGPRGFEKIGAGTLVLTGTNTYSGVTTISGGVLSVSRASNLGSGASTNGLVLNGGTLRVTGLTTLGTTTTITSNGGTIDTAGANASLAAGTIFNGQLVKTGTGTLQIRGSSTGAGGVALNQGQISIQNGDGLGTGVLSMAAGTILTVTSPRQTVTNDIVLGDGSGSLIAPSGDTVLAGRLSGGRLNVGSRAGNVILTNDANNYGITAIETGNGVIVGSGGRSGRLGTGEVINNGLLAFNRADAITVGNVISGNGTVRVQGAGSVTLSAVNTYTGATLVNAGTLLVTGSLNSDVTVGSGAVFGGTGIINGTVTINNRGGLAAGPGAGVLTMNNLVLNAGSVTTFDLGAAGVAGGPNNDLIRVTGNLTVNGGRINVARGAGFSRGQYTLFEFDRLTGTIGNLTLAPIDGGFVGNLAQGTGTVLLNVATAADMVWWNGTTTSPAGSVIGGNGTWNRTDRNFSNAAGNVSAAWAGDGALAVFGGTSGTVTIAAGTRLSPAGLNFLTDGYVIAGANATSGLALGGPTGVETAAGVRATISAVISGTGSVTKTGAGSLTLGGANTFTGGTSVLGGTLLANTSGALGSGAAGVTVADGATLSLGIGTTITKALTLNGLGVGAAGALQVNSAAQYDGAITLGSASRIFGNGGFVNDIATDFALSLAGRLTVEGAITGSGGITVEGFGDAILSGANSYAGTTTINALASLSLSGSGTFGTGNVINNGSIVINRSSDGTIANAISGAGSLQVLAGGTTTTLTGANSYAGQTTIVLGTLIAANNTALGTAAGGTLVQGAATLGLQGGISITDEALTLNGNGVGGLGSLRNFAGNNSFTGPITLGASSLIASDAGLLTLGGIALGTNSLTVAGNGGTTIGGAISGSGALTKTGSGTLTLSGNNTPFTGAINIFGGVLSFASSFNLGPPTGAGTLTIDGGTLRTTGVVTTPRDVTIGAAGGTIDTQNAVLGLGGSITFNGQLIKTGAGGLGLIGNNTGAGGVRLDEGTITFTTNSAFGTGTVSMAAGTTLFAGLAGRTLNNAIVLGGGAGSNIDPFDNVNPTTLAGVLSGGQLNVVGGAGRLVLTGANTYGATTVAAGNTLQIGSGGTTGTLGTGGVTLTAANSALVFNRSNDLTVANVISGLGTLTKQGTGTLTLTGANTYTGGTTISAGTLRVSSDANLGGNARNTVTLNGGTLLAAGPLTINGRIGAAGGTINVEGTGFVNSVDTVFDGLLTKTTTAVNGTVILFGTGTGNGGVLLDKGYLQLFNPGAMGTGRLTMAEGTLLGVNDSPTAVQNAITLGGGAGSSIGAIGAIGEKSILAGEISGGSLTFSGLFNGTLVLTGNNTYTGTTTINGRTLQIGDGGTSGTLGGGAVINNTSLVFNRSNDLTVGNFISGLGTLTKQGAGTLTLTGANTYSGETRVDAGTLAVATGGTIAGQLVNNATFTNAGTVSGSVTNSGTLTSTGTLGSGLINQTGGTASLAGAVNGGVQNSGTIALTGATTGITTFVQASGGVFNLFGFATTLGSLSGSGTISLGAAGLTVGGNGADARFDGVIAGSGTLTKTGTGLFVLGGVNSFTGLTTVSAGTLTLASGGVLAGAVTNAASFGNAGTVNGLVTNAGALVSTGTLAGGLANNAGATATLAGAVGGDITNAGTITLDSGFSAPGTVTQTAAGVFDITRTDAIIGGLAGAGSVLLGARTLQLGGNDASTSFAGIIAGSGGITKLGTGTLTLNAVQTFTGLTTVSGGTLTVSGTGGLAGAVLNAATLTNAGTIGGQVSNTASLTNTGTIAGQVGNAAGASATNSGTIGGSLVNAGTFSNSGTVSGGVSNSGILTSTGTLSGELVNQSGGTASLAGTVSGGVQNGGTITLTGTTTGIGLFDQAAGGSFDLAGFDTALGGLAGAGSVVLGAARLTIGSGNAGTIFAGVISGSGSLTKTGTGTFVLSGANTYAGGTTISGGALQIGAGGTTGSIIGPVVNNGALVISRSDAVTFGNLVTGTGMLVQDGTGTTTLTAANTYTGGTLVNRGRLVGTTTSLQGLIQINAGAALEFAQGPAGTFAGSLLGAGLFEKTGAGLLTLTGNSNAFTGATSVRAGELRVNGGLAGSVVTVGTGARLSGTGVIGGLIAQSGSTIAPGTSPGVLGVAGNVTLQAGSTSVFEVSAAGPSDLILATGTASLGGTAALINLGGTYGFGSQITLVQADGGRSGAFANVTGLEGFGIRYRPELVYVAGQARLRMAPNTLANIAGTAALTANQRAVVSRIDGAMTAGYNPDPLFNIYSLPAAQLPGAFDQLSGEAYATAAGVGIEQERFMREAVLGRLASVRQVARSAPDLGKGVQAWGQLYGGWGDGESNGNAAAFEADRMGFVTGLDIGNASENGSWRVGAFGMRVQSDVTIAARGSRAEVNQAGGGAYAALTAGGFGLSLGGYLSAVDLRTFRNIALPGFADNLVGTTEGKARQAFAELSYTIEAGDAQIRPFVAGSAGRLTLDALTERGGAAALAMRDQRYNTGTVTGGIDAAVPVGKVLRLGGALAARRHLGDRDPQAQLALAAAPQQAFAVQGAQIDRTALSARLDAMFTFEENLSITLGYSGLIGNTQTDHAARATIEVRF